MSFGSDGWNRTTDLGVMNLTKQCPALLFQAFRAALIHGGSCCFGVFCSRFVRGPVPKMQLDFKKDFEHMKPLRVPSESCEGEIGGASKDQAPQNLAASAELGHGQFFWPPDPETIRKPQPSAWQQQTFPGISCPDRQYTAKT